MQFDDRQGPTGGQDEWQCDNLGGELGTTVPRQSDGVVRLSGRSAAVPAVTSKGHLCVLCLSSIYIYTSPRSKDGSEGQEWTAPFGHWDALFAQAMQAEG